MNSSQWDVIVVGAGLAGLTAGATAAKGGARTLVLEAREPGGRARATVRGEFVLNLGAHALLRAGETHQTLRELGIPVSGSAPPLRKFRARAGGRQHTMPTGPMSLVRTSAVSLRGKAQLGKVLSSLPRLDPAEYAARTVDDWLAALEIRPDAEAMLRAMTRLATYTDDFDELSADAAISQLQRSAQAGVLYVDGGWGELVDGLRRLVEVRSHAAVRSITDEGRFVRVHADTAHWDARAVVVATGDPESTAALLPGDLRLDALGRPAFAACLDVGVRRTPTPGYVLGVDEPMYGTTQAPPAAGQAPPGSAVVSAVRFGVRSPGEDRTALAEWLPVLGVERDDVVFDRFLARMTVMSAQPAARSTGLAGRPATTASGLPTAFIAGDWVGPSGLLSDASAASGHQAGLAALRLVREGEPARR